MVIVDSNDYSNVGIGEGRVGKIDVDTNGVINVVFRSPSNDQTILRQYSGGVRDTISLLDSDPTFLPDVYVTQ